MCQVVFRSISNANRIFLSLPDETGRWRHSVLNRSVCSSVTKLVNVIFENECTNVMPISADSPWGKAVKQSTLGVRTSKVKVTRGQI